MATKAKVIPRLIKVLILNKNKATFRAELFSVSPKLSIIKISEQTANENEVKTVTKIPTVSKELLIVPDLKGLKKGDLEKRTKSIATYVKKHGVSKALELVGDEIIKAEKAVKVKVHKDATDAEKKKTDAANKKIDEANAKLEDTVITWQPRIEKDLKFKIQKQVQDTAGFEDVESISTEIEYTYKQIEKWELYFKLRPRDFMKHVQNYLNKK